jgi:hypothetical protein
MGRIASWLAGVGTAFVRWLGTGDAPDRPATPVAPAPVAPAPIDDGAGPYADVAAFRRHIYEDYRFTPQARRLLAKVRITIHNMREPVGGGLWFGPVEGRIELQGIQDEAAIHELAHAYADYSGFYTEYDPDWPHWKTRNSAFRADVHAAAVANDQRYARISFICREYEFGNPETGFPGMFENDSERFAGLASGCMGDLLMLPPAIRRWYTGLFEGTRGAVGEA